MATTTTIDHDYLDEDPVIPNQMYYLLSYLLSDKTENKIPMIKIRGVFRDRESAQKRVKILEDLDTYFDIILAEVGKWSPLLTKDELLNTSEVEQQYREQMLQNIMKSYKENQEESKALFESRKENMIKKANDEGSSSGQAILAEQKEEPIVLINRIKTYNDMIAEFTGRIVEVKQKLNEDTLVLDGFTKEEINESSRKFEEYIKENQSKS